MTTQQTPQPQPIPAATPAATPDNTPIPGGGSWHWDYTASAWAANPKVLPPAATQTTATTPEPAQE